MATSRQGYCTRKGHIRKGCNTDADVHRNTGTQVELPTGCVPYSVKKKNDSDKKCPQGCLLTGFDSDTDATKRAGLLGDDTLRVLV